MAEITEMQLKMINAVGHRVEIRIIGGCKPFIGKCTGFTKPLDNEPEVAEITIRVPGISGQYNTLYGIIEDEIESITIIN